MKKLLTMIFCMLAATVVCVSVADAQAPPFGQATLDQGLSYRAITPSDTTQLVPTRGLFNGNATACILNVVGTQDTAAVAFNNVQPGQILPISVTKVMSSTTNCTNIVGIW